MRLVEVVNLEVVRSATSVKSILIKGARGGLGSTSIFRLHANPVVDMSKLAATGSSSTPSRTPLIVVQRPQNYVASWAFLMTAFNTH